MTNNMRWDLSPLYPSFESEEFGRDKDLVEKQIEESKVWIEENLSSTDNAAQKLEYIIKSSSELTSLLTKLFAFTQLTLATDAKNEEALGMMFRLEKINVASEDLQKKIVRFVGKVENLNEVIESSELLKEHSFYLNELKQESTHLLGEEVEPVISKLRITGSNAWSNLRSMLDGTHEVDIEVDGEMKSLPLPIVRNMAYDKDPVVRKKGYEAELAAYKKVEIPLSHAINAIKGETNTIAELRGFDSVLDMTLEQSRLDKDTLDAMLDAIKDFLPHFRRYLKAKAKVLGYQGGLPFYDLFAPLGGDNVKKYTYEEAHQYLVDVFSGFSSEMAEFIDTAFKENWIDAESRPGKGGGAFCANLIPIKQSRVLANFDGSFSQVSTLAHELGHAWHGHCLKDLSILNTSYPMPLAETASIFNEGIVADIALEKANDEEKFALLESDLMECTQTIVDIYSRFLFEKEVIETRLDHGMSITELKDAMIRAQKAAYGDALDENYLHPYMWACKIHYYFADLSYYNWPYAFGMLFAKGVLAEYKKVGSSFVQEYKDLLAATGSDTIADVAKRLNIDVRCKDFWVQSLTEVKENIDKFCKLVDEKY
jgi:pepF/M3 family oligoendopeptidase